MKYAFFPGGCEGLSWSRPCMYSHFIFILARSRWTIYASYYIFCGRWWSLMQCMEDYCNSLRCLFGDYSRGYVHLKIAELNPRWATLQASQYDRQWKGRGSLWWHYLWNQDRLFRSSDRGIRCQHQTCTHYSIRVSLVTQVEKYGAAAGGIFFLRPLFSIMKLHALAADAALGTIRILRCHISQHRSYNHGLLRLIMMCLDLWITLWES